MSDRQRFPDLRPEQMTEAQKRVHDAIAAGPRGGVHGPFSALLHSPELADRVQQLGEYVRFRTSLPPHLTELAILVNARFWRAAFEWHAHSRLGREAGLDPALVDAIGRDERPARMRPDEEVVYDFCTALHRQHFVDDGLFARATSTLGQAGVMELIGVSGYYTLVSMVLNVAQVPLPPGASVPW